MGAVRLSEWCQVNDSDSWLLLQEFALVSCSKRALLRRLKCFNKIASSANWGDENTLSVAAFAYGQRIVVLQDNSLALVYQPEAAPVSLPEIVILYNGTNHYESTRAVLGVSDAEDMSDEDFDAAAGSESGSEADGSVSSAEYDVEEGGCYVNIEAIPTQVGVDSMEESLNCKPKVMDAHESPAYQAKRELCASYLAQEHIRAHPTVPPDPEKPEVSWGDPDDGTRWPQKHCAFSACCWHGTTDNELKAHLKAQHGDAFCEAVRFAEPSQDLLVDMIRTGDSELDSEKLYAWYCAAIAVREAQKMPTVGCSIDRRAGEAFASRCTGEQVSAPICFTCARIQVNDKADQSSDINWRKPFNGQHFARMNSTETEDAIGLETYLHEYGSIPNTWQKCETASVGGEQRQLPREAFNDWSVTVPFKTGGVTVLCCPEDRRCDECEAGGNKLCTHCEVPICNECWSAITSTNPHRPALALSNDLWFGYLPEMIYAEEVTYMELLCASICHPTMLSFQVSCHGWDMRLEKVHGQKNRLGARGNMTAFQVPWETVFEELHQIREAASVQLPRVGMDLLQVVQVLFQHNGNEIDDEQKARLLKSATVRREVVIRLIEEMVKCGHRDYVNLDMEVVKKRALELPATDEHGRGKVPSVVYTVLETRGDHNAEAEVGGKPAVPPDSLIEVNHDARAIVDPLLNQRLTHVAGDMSSHADVDMNVTAASGLLGTAEKLAGPEDAPDGNDDDALNKATMTLTMGEAQSQLESTFFLTAYAFMFPHSVGAPDLKYQARDRRLKSAPRVDFADDWCRCLMTRAEGQFRRDLTLPFALWNLHFRTTINIGHNMFSVKRAVNSKEEYTASDFRAAAENICACLNGEYVTGSGARLKVNGDMGKLRTAGTLSPPLTPLAKSMLESLKATCRKIEGTQEVRAVMRRELLAYRVALGRPIMVTFSPSERHNILMIRLSRARASDPVVAVKHETQHMWGGLNEPELLEHTELGEIDIADLLDKLPSSDERRSILAKDPLASVYGFRLLCKLSLATLFGVRVCTKCPDCNLGDGCVDEFGSVAAAEGGVFGRPDGYYGSLENQKEDALHVHMMLWLQCLNQHMTLEEIALRMINDSQLLQQYKSFKSHVCSENYHDIEAVERQRENLESEGPEYKSSARLLVQPSCPEGANAGVKTHVLSDFPGEASEPRLSQDPPRSVQDTLKALRQEGKKWKHRNLAVVDEVKQRVNHHIHKKDAEGIRHPMPYCRSKSNPEECTKGGYPKDKRLFDDCVVVCKGLAQKRGMPVSGRRNMQGALDGPRNDPWLNGSHPALLKHQRCNSDVMIPYRVPILECTHEKLLCNMEGCLRMDRCVSVRGVCSQARCGICGC